MIETVAVYRDLPEGLLKPCAEPEWSPGDIATDVDLMGLLKRYKVTNDCNADKIIAIDKIYRSAPE